MSQITDHVSTDEFRCSCCGKLPPDLEDDEVGGLSLYYDVLLNAFENLRTSWGKPIKITSGYRCPKHNAEVGGGAISAHMFGALDLWFPTAAEADKFAKLLDDEEPDLRMGRKQYKAEGKNIVHMDCAYLISPKPVDTFMRGARW